MTRSPGRTHSDTFLRTLSQSRQALCKIMRMWQCRDTTGQKFTISEVEQWGASLHRTKVLARSWHIFTRICCFADSHPLFYLSLSKLICKISKPAYWQETPLAWGYSDLVLVAHRAPAGTPCLQPNTALPGHYHMVLMDNSPVPTQPGS
jgi:hypothetical protein